MTDSHTTSSTDETVDVVKIGRAGVALDDAFTDLTNIALLDAPDMRLQEVVPAPPPIAFDELEQESRTHRVLFWRGGAVIAVTTIVAIGGALFIHTLFAGIFILAALFGFAAPNGDGHGGDAVSEGGASPEGYMTSDTSSTEMPGALAALGAPDASLLPMPAPTALPSLPEAASTGLAVQQLQAVVGSVTVPMVSDMGTVKIRPPARVTEQTALSTNEVDERAAALEKDGGAGNALRVSPPSALQRSSKTGNAVASASTGVAAAGVGEGEERVYSLFKGDGVGKGKGSGQGNGIDRGFSAANSEAQILNVPAFPTPMQYQLKPPPRQTILEITVLADGTAGDVQIAQSCGVKDLDQSLVILARTAFRYRPAFHEGKAVQSVVGYKHTF